MKTVMILTLLALFLHDTTAVIHTMEFFSTLSSEVPDFPEFVSVGMVDGIQADYYDSNMMEVIPKQDWMNKITEYRDDYWEWETGNALTHQQWLKANIEVAKQRFNQTGGVHVYQLMQGCDWDDETNEVNGYHQFGYDGKDFITLDMKTMTYVTPIPQAVFTKNQLNSDIAKLRYYQYYYTHECVYLLWKFVSYGKDYLMKKDLPTVSLLQKSPSSPITCHATGFYPNRAVMFWRKDGEELHKLHKDAHQGEILPNPDGSFQMSVDLELPSGDWEKYECVFQLTGVKEDIITRLEKREIKTNYVDHTNTIIGNVSGVLVVLALIIAGGGYLIRKRRTAKRPPSPASDSGVEQSMLPNPSS
ncbi:class I histocompatibility antigen, F10 alpha chain-like [Cheilinus undulatus]|uniref:class I histocompatibility antigen, F10 alpha chain-like n=1 Tax=Cheilinus undulatus TaxID=241271 RepID=UPI001BD42AC2|nr:class I histocompatibility antigen, F10 alpha chain-like [Cheilinus undulatus]